MAILPEDMEQETIIRMSPGDSAWCVPWAVWVDGGRNLWISGDYTIEKEPGGTVAMKITRTPEGVKVDRESLSHYFGGQYKFSINCERGWTPDDLPVEWV